MLRALLLLDTVFVFGAESNLQIVHACEIKWKPHWLVAFEYLL